MTLTPAHGVRKFFGVGVAQAASQSLQQPRRRAAILEASNALHKAEHQAFEECRRMLGYAAEQLVEQVELAVQQQAE